MSFFLICCSSTFAKGANRKKMYSEFKKPIPIDKEVVWDKSLTILSKTDAYGTIEYVNEVFVDVSGYEEFELITKPHNLIRHPDMPKVVFKVMWEHIQKGMKFHGIVKNLAKSGRYYWVITDFDYVVDEEATIQNFIARRKAVPLDVVRKVEVLYKRLLQIEEAKGIEASEKYLIGYLEEFGLSYVQFITKLMVDSEQVNKTENTPTTIQYTISDEEKITQEKGFFSRFFGV